MEGRKVSSGETKEVKNESSPDEVYLDGNLCVQAMVKMAQKLGFNTGLKEDPE